MRQPTPNIMDELMPTRSETATIQQELRWDYSQLGEAAGAVMGHAIEIKRVERRASEAIVEAGRHLIAVKESLDHGQWEDWLETEFKMSARTAQRMMAVTRQFDGKTGTVSLLGPSVLYLLAGDSVPEPAREAVIDLAKSGETVTKAQAQTIIDAHKPARPNPQPAMRRYESGLPALNMPSPGAAPSQFGAQPKLPITDWELSDICETVAGEMFGEITRSRVASLTEAMVSDANAQNGAYWLKLLRSLAPFDAPVARIQAAVADAAQRMVAERSAPAPASTMTPEAKQLSREIKAATWGDKPYAEVWEIQNALGRWEHGLTATELRTLAKFRGGANWFDCRVALGELHYRDRDLVQALNNLANQMEQRVNAPAIETTIAPTVAYVVPARQAEREGEGETEGDPWVAAWAQRSPDVFEARCRRLAEAMLPWAQAWTDDKGRTWRDVVERNPQHANSPFRQELDAECQRRGVMMAGAALATVIMEVFSCLTAADEAARQALTADERTADFADDAEGEKTAADGGKLLTEWTEADWATYAATGRTESTEALTGDDLRVMQTAASAGAPAVDVVAVDGRELPEWVREEERSVAMLPADMAGRWVIVSDGAGQVFLEDKAGKRSTERGGLEIFEELVDQARRMDGALVVADDRAGRLMGWLVRLLTLRSELVDWGELTGHHLDTLAIGRELDKLVGMTQRELDMLTGTPDIVEVDGEQEVWG